ncbi:MAG: hypothetical protein KGY69_16690 [Bacteroidales bacterium]|nr:hypothetical protein [Bacteroidales bacterium]
MFLFSSQFSKSFIICCFLFVLGSLFVEAQDTYTSTGSGNWTTKQNWDQNSTPTANDIVIISDGTIIDMAQDQTCAELIVESGGQLERDGRELTVTGDIRVDGLIGGNGDIFLQGTESIIDGAGTAHGSVFIENGDKMIPDTADLTIEGDFNYSGDHTITNNGTITLTGHLVENSSGSVWTNAAGSKLNIGSSVFSDNGSLDATGNNNTVNYNGSSQDIKDPVNSEYYHLEMSGSGTAQLQNDVTVKGNLTINSGSFNTNSLKIEIKGDWTNSGTFEEENGTVVFNGAGYQSINSTTSETFYDLKLLSGGDLTLQSDVIVSTSLTLNTNTIYTEVNKLILGTSCSNTGTLYYTSGTIAGAFERYINSSSIPSPPVLFPLGTGEYYRPAEVTFNNIISCGSVVGEFVNDPPGSSGLPLDDGAERIYNTFVEGYWQLTENNGFDSDDFDLTLTGNGFTTFPTNASNRILSRTGTTNDWQANGTHVDVAGNTAERDNVTILSGQYCFGDTTNCTPPETPSITAEKTDVCTGETGVNYEVSNASASDTCYWEVDGGTIETVEGASGESIYVNWGSTGQVGNVEAVRVNDCAASAPTSVSINIHSMAPSEINGPMGVAEEETGATYSVDALSDYSYYWSVSGGNITSGDGTSSITVDWGSAGTGTIEVYGEYDKGCAISNTIDTSVTIYNVIESVQDGSWNQKNTWDCNCVPTSATNVRIVSNHTVDLKQNRGATHFILESGAVFQDGGNTFTVSGNYTNEGYHQGSANLILDGTNTYINGKGTISSSGDIIIKNGSKTILPSVNLTKNSGDFSINGSQTVTNEGIITLGGDITGTNGSWINEQSATLNFGGTSIAPSLSASALYNTVNYNANGTQDVKVPEDAYYNLTISGSDIKTMQGNLDVDNNMSISSTLSTSSSNYNIHVGGNWTNTGTFNEGSGKVVFDGSTDQAVDNTSGDELFNDFELSKSGGLLNTDDHITVSNELVMTKGSISTSDTITLGTGTSTPGNLIYNSGSILGKFERWINSTDTEYLFPVGISTSYRPLMAEFKDLSSGSVVSEFIASDPGTSGISSLNENGFCIADVFSEGYWRFVNENSLSSNSYNIEVEANGFDDYAIKEDTRLLTRPDEGSDWTLDGSHVNANIDTVRRNSVGTLAAEFGVAEVNKAPSPDIAPDDSIPTVCYSESITLEANASGTDYTWEKNETVVSNSQTYEFSPSSNPEEEYIEETFTITVGSDGCSGSDSHDVRVYRRPETGNQYYVPNEFDQ